MSQVRQVKDAVNIVDVIGEKVQLQKSGANFKAPCPFHSEKTPSFFVSDVMQRYRCFGCGKSGDVLTFLQEYEGMSFGESMQTLADRAGIKLERFQSSAEDQLRDNLLAILDLAARFYHFLLTEHASGEIGREYFKKRGVTSDSVKLFKLGYAPGGWDHLIQYLHEKKKYSLSEIEQAGLIIKGRTGRYYDRFRGRVIFPLTNHRGQVVGMAGRTLKVDAKEAKYINTPETSLYHKAELLYGYSELYQHIRKAEEVIVVEGELDMISSQQAHVNHVVAIKGSALTAGQVKLLKRTVSKVILALDTDAAGLEATRRAIEVAEPAGLEVRVIRIPAGKDPDELAKSDPKKWREVATQSVSVYEFLISAAVAEHDPSKPEGKRKIMDSLAPVLTKITHSVEQDFYIKKLAEVLGVKEELVKQDMSKFGKPKILKLADKAADKEEKEKVTTRRQRLEQYASFLVLESPVTLRVTHAAALLPELTSPELTQLISALSQSKPESSLKYLLSQLPSDIQTVVAETYLDPEFSSSLKNSELAKEWQLTLKQLREESHRIKLQAITNELDTLDEKTDKTAADEERQATLLREIVELQRQMNDNPK